MDTDYQDRTVLHLITKYGYEPLCRNAKIKILLDKLWVGAESYACDGQDTDFSLLTFLSNAPVKKLPMKPLELKTLTRNGYKPSYEQNKF